MYLTSFAYSNSSLRVENVSYWLLQGCIRKQMGLSVRINKSNVMKGLFTKTWANFWKLTKGQGSTLGLNARKLVPAMGLQEHRKERVGITWQGLWPLTEVHKQPKESSPQPPFPLALYPLTSCYCFPLAKPKQKPEGEGNLFKQGQSSRTEIQVEGRVKNESLGAENVHTSSLK